jgi:aerobic carbon-monoxide dehydrogenase medium subunit
MTPFELVEPTSLQAALALLDENDPTVRPFAGGTALMLMMKAGVFRPTRLVSLGKIEERYSKISISVDGELRIGAMTPLSTLEYSREIRNAFPVFAQALRTLSNIRVRNVARVGGALAHGDPHMDLPPLLASLNARAVVVGPKGQREIRIDELYLGYYKTVLAENELIAEVIVPNQKTRRAAYFKYTTRCADDWPALGIAVSIDTDGKAVREASLVVSAATEKVTRLSAAQKVLAGAAVTDDTLRQAGEAAIEEAELVADSRGSVPYKRELLRVCIGRAVRMALNSGAAA